MNVRIAAVIAVLVLAASACAEGSGELDAPTTTSAGLPAVPGTETTTGPATAEEADPSTTTSGSSATTLPGSDPAGSEVEQTDEPTSPTPGAAPASPSQGSGAPVYQPGDIDPGLQPFIDQAIADLAARNGVEPSAIAVHAAVLVVWPDASLGCPQPGMSYAQVTMDGSVIELMLEGTVFRYHSGGTRGPFLCEQSLDKTPPSGDLDVGGRS